MDESLLDNLNDASPIREEVVEKSEAMHGSVERLALARRKPDGNVGADDCGKSFFWVIFLFSLLFFFLPSTDIVFCVFSYVVVRSSIA